MNTCFSGHACRALLALSCALPALVTPAHAQEASDSASIVVVAAIDTPQADLSDDARNLNRAEINTLAPVTALESLSLVPGVVAFEKGGAGGGSYLAVRGGEPNFTQVTINGIRVNDPLQTAGGAFDFSLLDPADVTGIGILAGPLSTPYGADALSGVAALGVGAGDAEHTLSLHSGIGTGGRWVAGGSLAMGPETGNLFASVNHSDTEDFLDGSTSRRTTYLAAISPVKGDQFTLNLFGLVANADSTGFPEDSGGPELAVSPLLETRDRALIVLGGAARAALSDGLSAQLKLGWSRSDLFSDNPGIAPGALDPVPPIVTDSRFERLEVAAQFDHVLAPDLGLAWGGNFVSERGRSAGTLDFGFPIPTDYSAKRTLPGLYAMAHYGKAGEVMLTAGLRADFPEGSTTRWTPRVGGQMPLGASGFFITANYAQGFKQPSLFALGFPLIANPDLQAERSTTYDAGVDWRSGDGASTVGAKLFRSDYRDLIDFDPDLFTNVNRAKVRAEGAELWARYDAQSFKLRAALTYLDTQSADGVQLRFRPKWTGRAALDVPIMAALDLRVDGELSSKFYDSSVPTGMIRQDGFATLGAQLRWAFTDNLAITASLRNALDERYSRNVGTPEPGRNVFIRVEAGF